MCTSASDPSRLDVAAFAKARGTLRGATDLTQLGRLAESTLTLADGPPGSVEWALTGLCSDRAGSAPDLRLHLVAHCTLWLQCQRCLQPMAEKIQIDGTFRFVAGEDEAARLDEESEEDVLALPRALKLDDLIEDELILALPIIARHPVCPEPIAFDGLAHAEAAAPQDEPAPHPFAALAGLRTGKPTG